MVNLQNRKKERETMPLRTTFQKEEIWHEEAGIVPNDGERSDPQYSSSNLYAAIISRAVQRIRLTLTMALHKIRCKWAVAACSLLVGIIILATTVPIIPLSSGLFGKVEEEGLIGPQLDPKMRPCRKTLNFSPTPLPRIALASFAGSGSLHNGLLSGFYFGPSYSFFQWLIAYHKNIKNF